MKEADIQRQIQDALKQLDIPCWRMPLGGNIHRGKMYKNPLKGFPDLFGVLPNTNGRMYGIEVKSPKGTLRPEQRDWARIFGQYDVIHVVARSLDEVINEFRKQGYQIETRQLIVNEDSKASD